MWVRHCQVRGSVFGGRQQLFDDNYLSQCAEKAILEASTAVAMKRVIAWQIAKEMKAQQMTKTDLAMQMHTSRAVLNRLLDEKDGSLTLTTLASAAAALGKRVNLQLAPA